MWIFAVLFGWCWRRSARVNTGLYSKAIRTVRCFYEALSGHKGKVATHALLLCAGWTFSTEPIRGGRLVIWPCILWLPHVSTGIPPWGSYSRGPTQRTSSLCQAQLPKHLKRNLANVPMHRSGPHREVNMNWVWLGVSILHYYRNNPQLLSITVFCESQFWSPY